MSEQLQDQIASRRREIEQARLAAVRAEQARVEAEQAPKRAIASAQAELAQLERQAAEARYFEIAQTYRAMLSDIHSKADEMFTALLKADFTTARAQVKTLATMYHQAQALRNSSYAQLEPYRESARIDAYNNYVDGQRGIIELSQLAERDPAVGQFSRYNLPEPPIPLTLVEAWINAVPEGFSRQERRGLCFAAFGMMGEPFTSLFARFTPPLHFA